MKQTKPIVIIATIQPPDGKGKRKVSVAAAPEGQLPARTLMGTYPDLHGFIDQAWIIANTERPAHVEKPAAKPVHGKKVKPKGKVAINEPAEGEDAEAEKAEVEHELEKARADFDEMHNESDQIGPVETEAEAVEASEPEAATEEISEDQLPLIEGDED